MNKLTAWFADEAHRAYLYRIAVVVVPLLVAGGMFTDGTAQVVYGVLAAVLGVGSTGLAAVNTSTSASKVKVRRYKASDPRLGRHVHHDPRSRFFAAPESDLAALKSVRHTRNIPILNQGQVGSCTGNASTGCLASGAFWAAGSGVLNADATADEKYALGIYSDAETIDGDGPYPPNDNGSSGLSVAKVLKNRGLIAGYSHAFTLNAALTALASQPVIIGIEWRQDMFNPAPDGRLSITGKVAGGHEIVLTELDVENKRVWLDNSWGASWGIGGRAYLTWDDFGTLLAADGDCTVFTALAAPAPTPVPTDEHAAALADLQHWAATTKSCPKHIAHDIAVIAGA